MRYAATSREISKIVAAFDIDKRKVGKPLEEAIFAPPNCTKTIEPSIPATGVTVLWDTFLMGYRLT